ncbi:MAG: methyltransferase family protein [Fidelibacterota bacterium]
MSALLIWTLISLAGIILYIAWLNISFLQGKRYLVAGFFVIVEVPRVVIPLLQQPRIPGAVIQWTGWLVFIGTLIVAAVALTQLSIGAALQVPGGDRTLIKTGIYSFIRNPLYFADSLWPLGWSMVHGAVYGMLLTILWFASFYLLTIMEERKLEKVYGEEFREYCKRVPRIIPFVKSI